MKSSVPSRSLPARKGGRPASGTITSRPGDESMKKHLDSLKHTKLRAGEDASRARRALSEQDLERVTGGDWGCPYYIDSGPPMRHLGYAMEL